MENLHIQDFEKFTEPYIKFINDNFNPNEHLFAVIGNQKSKIDSSYKNIHYINRSNSGAVPLIKYMYKSERIFLHSLLNKKVVLLLFLQPWLLKKCYWAVWGGDLYRYSYSKGTFKSKLYEFVRKFVIKNIGGIITHIKGDYELAKKWYGTKGKYYYSFMYPSNLFKEYDLSSINKDSDTIYIQVGNSADPTNNHLEVFKKLNRFRDKSIKIICPLSYPLSERNEKYRDKIIEVGYRVFDDKFIPLLDFMPFDKYLEFLAKVDVAIFNHKRQQAVGNITSLLSLGKKVYIRDDITTWSFCENHALKVYSIDKEFKDIFKPIPNEIKKKNVERVKTQFSEKKLVDDWAKIFSSKA